MINLAQITKAKKAAQERTALKTAFSIAIPFIVMAVILCVYGIRYDTNDDATLANLSAGAYGNGLYTVHLNIILSAIMRPLYILAGDVNWYVITQLIMTCLGIGTVFYCLCQKIGTSQGIILASALLIPFAGNFFYAFQYSKTSIIMLTGGLLLISENLKKFNPLTAAGILLCLWGSMTRWESFFAAGGLFAALLLLRFFSFEKNGKINAVVTMVVFFAVIFGAELTDRIIYAADDGWKEYVAYNAARTEYSDYRVYLLKGENIFAEEGITDCEFALLDRWDFYDEQRFSTDFINQLNAKVPGKTVRQTIMDTAYTFKTLLYGCGYRYVFLAVLVCAVLCARKKPQYLSVIGTVTVFGALLLFLLYRGRFTRWVESGLLWTVVVTVLFCIIETAPRWFKNTRLLVAVMLIFSMISAPEYINLKGESQYWKEHRIQQNSAYDQISQDKDNLYLLSCSNIDQAAGYDVWNPRADDYFSNIVAFGGWLSRTPYRDEVLNRYGVSRPMVDCVDNPNVYLDSSGIHIIAEYASRQLGVPVYRVKTGEYAVAPYQLVTKNE